MSDDIDASPVPQGPFNSDNVSSFRVRKNVGTQDADAHAAPSFKVNNGHSLPAVSDDESDSDAKWHHKQSIQTQMVYEAKGSIPNTPFMVCVISAGLGGLLAASLFAAAAPLWRLTGLADAAWARPQLGIYLAAMALFHLLEFLTTAGWNIRKLSVDAFLLNNGVTYHLAHAAGLIEYFVSSYLWPSKYQSQFASIPALLTFAGLMAFGQTCRSLAMIQAGHSFSHVVKQAKLDDHVLITHGVYSWFRHPSYVGFFYWAVGTQLFLGNVVSTLAFVVMLGKFFGDRIRHEEIWLRNFFGDAYIQYSKRVGTGLPFLAK